MSAVESDSDVGMSPNAAEIESDRLAFAHVRVSIDQSTRTTVLLLFTAAVFWLLAGSVLGMLASLKMHWPGLMADWSWLTFGRVRPAHLNTMAYGWASQAGIGVMLWMTARLARTQLKFSRLCLAAAIIWNVAVLLGTIGILAGQSTSVEWLEFPPYVPPLLTAAFGLIMVATFATFANREEGHVYVSQWYLFGAVFWFPWLYMAANALIVLFPLTGVLQATVNWWFAHNVLGLWLTPIGLAAAYYLIPKVLGRPIHSYYLSIIGFWALAFFYNSAGIHHLIGGPVPAWLITYSIVASVMMFIPVGTVAINHHMTMVGSFNILRYSPTLRFIVFGAMSYTAVSVQGSLQSLRTINEVTHFTHYTVAHAHLGIYAFFTMIMFGSMYYIVPRLTGGEWASAWLIRIHFWSCAVGIGLYWIVLTWGGWYQGEMLNDASVPFMDIVNYMLPYLKARSWSGVLLTVGHTAFAVLLVLNLLRRGQRREDPTLLGDPQQYRQTLADASQP